MSDWGPLAYDIIEALRRFQPGEWVAVVPEAASGSGPVVAQAATYDEVVAKVAAQHAGTAIVLQVPLRLPVAATPVSVNPPTGLIRDVWQQGEVVAFLGAGASTGCGLPSASDLIRELAIAAEFPGRGIADLDLAKVSSYYQARGMRKDLNRWLRTRFNAQPPPQFGDLHRLLRSDFGREAKLIITTNYDRLIEDAFDDAKLPYDLLIYPSDQQGEDANSALWIKHGQNPSYVQPNKLSLGFERTVIYKMHGSLSADQRWESFVITEDDYADFLSRMASKTAIPIAVMKYLAQRRILFLGYGLRDWNLRIILKDLLLDRENLGWAIQFQPNQVEDLLWQKRKIQLFNKDVQAFAREMLALVQPAVGAR